MNGPIFFVVLCFAVITQCNLFADSKQYTVDFSRPDCIETEDCAVYIGHVNDSYRIELNGEVVTDRSRRYLSFSSVVVALPNKLIGMKNKLIIQTYNLNGFLGGLELPEVRIDRYENVYTTSWLDWGKRTGIQLTSIYFLIVFSFVLLILWYKTRKREVLFLILYSLVASIYLFSFSELPRFYLDPAFASGPLHFSLRLIQDLFLFSLFHVFFSGSESFSKFFYTVVCVYLSVILLNIVSIMVGISDFSYYLGIIVAAAPLVAFPMAYGFFLSVWNKIEEERAILIPATFILFLCQVNDLFVFWQLLPSYYTVRFYIPLVVILLLYVVLVRGFKDYDDKRKLALKSRLALQLFHDVKSPAMVLGVVSRKLDIQRRDSLLEKASIRIQRLVDRAFSGFVLETTNLYKLVLEAVDQKQSEIDSTISFKSTSEDLKVLVDVSAFDTVLSNILNNAYEAAPNKEISVSVFRENGANVVSIVDQGPGIPKEIINSLAEPFKGPNRKVGRGLGLSHAQSAIASMGGQLFFANSDHGSVVELRIPSIENNLV